MTPNRLHAILLALIVSFDLKFVAVEKSKEINWSVLSRWQFSFFLRRKQVTAPASNLINLDLIVTFDQNVAAVDQFFSYLSKSFF